MLFPRQDAELWLEEQIPLGAKVEIETSSLSLVVGTLITLGIPLGVASVVFYLSSSWTITASAVMLSFVLAIACCKTEKFRLLLVSRVRKVV